MMLRKCSFDIKILLPSTSKELLVGLAEQIPGEGNFSLETLLAQREKKQYIEISTPLNTNETLEQCVDAFEVMSEKRERNQIK